jgi:hypothetical protein
MSMSRCLGAGAVQCKKPQSPTAASDVHCVRRRVTDGPRAARRGRRGAESEHKRPSSCPEVLLGSRQRGREGSNSWSLQLSRNVTVRRNFELCLHATRMGQGTGTADFLGGESRLTASQPHRQGRRLGQVRLALFGSSRVHLPTATKGKVPFYRLLYSIWVTWVHAQQPTRFKKIRRDETRLLCSALSWAHDSCWRRP